MLQRLVLSHKIQVQIGMNEYRVEAAVKRGGLLKIIVMGCCQPGSCVEINGKLVASLAQWIGSCKSAWLSETRLIGPSR